MRLLMGVQATSLQMTITFAKYKGPFIRWFDNANYDSYGMAVMLVSKTQSDVSMLKTIGGMYGSSG